jgi:glycosidase
MDKVTSFWLKDVGVDGFRLDAVRYMVEDEQLADSKANHAFLEEWGTHYRSINPQAFSVGEAWTGNSSVKKYTNTNLELDSAFNFDLSTAILKSVNESSNANVRFILQTTIRDFPEQDNANFITNHDMNRVISQIGGNDKQAKAKVMAGIVLTAPGIPFLYYGEEIGMSGVRTSGANADVPIRSPMQWTATATGFTDGTPWAAINPDSQTANVQAQTGDPNSLLEFYRALIQLRNNHSALRIGSTIVADSNSKKLVAYLRSSADENLLIVINIDDQPIRDYTLEIASASLAGELTAISLLDQSAITPPLINANGGFDDYTPLTEIPPYSIFVIQFAK